MEELNRRILGLRERIAYRRKLEAAAATTHESLDYYRAALPALEAAVRKEARDVERFEGMGPRAIVESVLGNRTDRLERERREYLAASLEHHACTHAIASCEASISELDASLASLGDVYEAYRAAIDEKERILASRGDTRAFRLVKLAEESVDVRFQIAQAAEAVAAGQHAIERLDAVSDAIDLVAGEFRLTISEVIAVAARPMVVRVADVAEVASVARDALRAFKQELADVGVKTKLKLELDALTEMSRSYFGGLYAQNAMQAGVGSARGEINALRDKVESLLAQVEALREACEVRLEALDEERLRTLDEV